MRKKVLASVVVGFVVERLYENIPAEQLKAETPALHDFIESGTAGYAGVWDSTQIDARLR